MSINFKLGSRPVSKPELHVLIGLLDFDLIIPDRFLIFIKSNDVVFIKK
jgi:hypothetical protein